MLQHYKKRGLISGAVFLSVPLVIATTGATGLLERMPRFVGFALVAVAVIAFLYSIASFVFAKGYSAMSGLGPVLFGPAVIAAFMPKGLSSIPMVIGLIILVFLPDKHREPKPDSETGER